MKKTNLPMNAKGRNPNGAADVIPAASAPNTAVESTEEAGDKGDGEDDSSADKGATTEDQATETPVATNPFATLPVVRANAVGTTDFEVQDLRGIPAEQIANPRKYAAAQATAVDKNLHMRENWKHGNDVFKIGSNRHDKKPSSVMGTIQQIVRAYGAEGCPAPALVTRLRTATVNNSRSHFCAGKLPPVGWAEDYIQGAMREGLIAVGGQIQHQLVPQVAPAPEPAPAEQTVDTAAVEGAEEKVAQAA